MISNHGEEGVASRQSATADVSPSSPALNIGDTMSKKKDVEGFCIVCNKYQEVKRLKDCYQCQTCGAKHRIKVTAGEPHLVGVVQLSNRNYQQKVIIIKQEEIDLLSYYDNLDLTNKPLNKPWKKVTRRNRWKIV